MEQNEWHIRNQGWNLKMSGSKCLETSYAQASAFNSGRIYMFAWERRADQSKIREKEVQALCNVSHLFPFQPPRKRALPSGSL